MSKKIIKKFLWCVSIISILFYGITQDYVYHGIRTTLQSITQRTVQNDPLSLTISFLNVGQGDAIYIREPQGTDILIDGGPDDAVLFELGKRMPITDRTIEVVIVTHPHADHISGLLDVLQKYEIGTLYYVDVLYDSAEYKELLNIVAAHHITLHHVSGYERFAIGATMVEFLYPLHNYKKMRVKNVNNTSIVTAISYQKKKILLMGDAESEVEQALIATYGAQTLKADILKLGHHGSISSSTQNFISSVAPTFGIIQCGQNNAFGHPHARILARLARQNTQILRTDQHGTITMRIDMQGIIHTIMDNQGVP